MMLVWEEDMVKALRKERESLREENARLRTAAMNLAKEVDDMRLWDSLNSFQLNRFSKYLDLLLVAAKGGIPIYPVAPCPGCTPLCDAFKAEVKRLEGLILDWADTREDVFGPRDALLAEAKRIRGEK